MKTNFPTNFLSFFCKASYLIIFIWGFPTNTQSHAPFLTEDGKNVIAANFLLASPLGLPPCEAPTISQISVSKVTETSATLHCSITSVKNYSWEYRVGGSSTWINAGVTKLGKIILKGLFPGTDYEYQVRVNCRDLFTWSDWSPAGSFSTQGQCKLPESIQIYASNITMASAKLHCRVPRSLLPSGSKFISYNWQIRIAGEASWRDLEATTEQFTEIFALQRGTMYEFRTRIQCSINNWSDWSAPEIFTTVCRIPLQYSATNITNSSARLICDMDGVISFGWQYRISSSSSWINTNNTTTNYVDILGLASGTAYQFRVRVQCASVWSDWSVPKTFLTSCNPATASHLSVSNITESSARLNCSVTGVNTYYWQYRLAGADAWAAAGATVNNYIDLSGLEAGTAYEFRVAMHCGTGGSGWSPSISFVTGCFKPNNFSQLFVTEVGSSSVILNCSLNGVEGYGWQYRLNGASDWLDLETTSGNHIKITGLSPGTTYQYRARVRCGSVWGDWSFLRVFTTYHCGIAPYSAQINVQYITESSARLRCDVNGIRDGFGWQYRVLGTSSWTDTSTSTSSFMDLNGLRSGTTYEYRARVKCGTSWSPWSVAKSFTTDGSCMAPTTSQFNGSSSSSGMEAILRCEELAVSAYAWQYRNIVTSEWSEIGWAPSRETTITVQPSSTYEYRVKVNCGLTQSTWSAIKTFSTRCAAPVNLTVTDVTPTRALLSCFFEYAYNNQFRWKVCYDSSNSFYTCQYWDDQPSKIRIENLVPGSTYNVQVQARCFTEYSSFYIYSDWSEVMFFTTLCDPNPPIAEDIFASHVTESSAKLNYRYNPDQVTQWKWRYRKFGSSGWVEAGITTVGFFQISGLMTGTTYEFQVSLYCGSVWGPFSETNTFTTICLNPLANQITATIIPPSSAKLSCSLGGMASYQWQYGLVPLPSGTAPLETLPFPGNFVYLNGLQFGKTYQYRARVQCADSWSDWSATNIFVMDCSPPDPVELSATNITSSSARLIWNMTDIEPSIFAWEYRQTDGPHAWISSGSSQNNYLDIDGLEPGANYEFRVYYYCGGGGFQYAWSSFSEPQSFQTLCPAPDLSELFATNITHHAARLNCLSDLNPSQYNWQYRISPSDPWIDLGATALNYFDLNNLNYNRLYEFHVAILCASGWSTYSEAQQFATAPTPAYMTPLSPSGINGQAMGLPASSKEIWLYPNPTSGAMHVENLESDGELMIFSLYGTLEQTFPVYTTSMEVDLSHLPNGVYFLKYRRGYKIITRRFYLIR